MSVKRITNAEAQPLRVSALPNRPSADRDIGGAGYTPTQLKAAFDALPDLLVERYNQLVDALQASPGAGSVAREILTGLGPDHTLEDLFADLASGAMADYLATGEQGETLSGMREAFNRRLLDAETALAGKAEHADALMLPSYDSSTGVLRFTNGRGETVEADFPVEGMITGGFFDPQTQELVLQCRGPGAPDIRIAADKVLTPVYSTEVTPGDPVPPTGGAVAAAIAAVDGRVDALISGETAVAKARDADRAATADTVVQALHAAEADHADSATIADNLGGAGAVVYTETFTSRITAGAEHEISSPYAHAVSVTGNTSQNLTGGNNLFDIFTLCEQELLRVGGVYNDWATITVDLDGALTITGEMPASVGTYAVSLRYSRDLLPLLKENTRYRCSRYLKFEAYQNIMAFTLSDSYISDPSLVAVYLSLRIRKEEYFSGMRVWPMYTEGEEVPVVWQPYGSSTLSPAAPQPLIECRMDGICSVGDNQLMPLEITGGDAAFGGWNPDGTFRCAPVDASDTEKCPHTVYFNLLPGAYILKCFDPIPGTVRCYVQKSDDDMTRLINTDQATTRVTMANDVVIRLYFVLSPGSPATNLRLGLFYEGAPMNSWEPYTETRVSLPQPLHLGSCGAMKDVADFERGVIYRRTGTFSLNGDEPFTSEGSAVSEGKTYYLYRTEVPVLVSAPNDPSQSAVCSHFVCSDAAGNAECAVLEGATGSLLLCTAQYASTEELAAWLARAAADGEPVTFRYALQSERQERLSGDGLHYPCSNYGVERLLLNGETVPAPVEYAAAYEDDLKQQIVTNRTNFSYLMETVGAASMNSAEMDRALDAYVRAHAFDEEIPLNHRSTSTRITKAGLYAVVIASNTSSNRYCGLVRLLSHSDDNIIFFGFDTERDNTPLQGGVYSSEDNTFTVTVPQNFWLDNVICLGAL